MNSCASCGRPKFRKSPYCSPCGRARRQAYWQQRHEERDLAAETIDRIAERHHVTHHRPAFAWLREMA